MARIEGKYILDHNENLVSYLTQLGKDTSWVLIKPTNIFFFVGFPEDKALKADEIKPQLDIRMEGNKYIMSSNSGIKNSSSSFTINTEYDDPMPTGEILKVDITFSAFLDIYLDCCIAEHRHIRGKQNYHTV